MRLEQLYYLQEIAKQHSISGAAKTLFISQPALSNALSSLETELDAQLFKRNKQGVTITPIGEQVLSNAENAIAAIEQIKTLVSAENARIFRGTITFVATPLICNALILDVVTLYKKSFPSIDITIKELPNETIIHDISLDLADFGVVSLNSTERSKLLKSIRAKDLFFRELSQEELCLFVNSSCTLANQSSVTMREIAQYPNVTFQQLVLKNGSGTLANNNAENYYFSDRESIKRMVAKNEAVSILPKFMATHDFFVESGLIVTQPISDLPINLLNGLVYNQDRVLLPFEQKFLALLIEEYDAYTRIE